MPVNGWRRWVRRAWYALECADCPPRAVRWRAAAALRLEELESRLTPSAFPAYPFVASIQRTDPVGPVTAVGTVGFTVTFSKAVTGVDPTDFRLAATGTIQAQSLQVTPVSESVYTVTVGGVTGTGDLGLNLVNNGSIRDLAGNPLVQQNAPASFGNLIGSLPPAAGSFAVTAADLTGNGKTDLVIANGSGINVLLGDGDGTFQPPVLYAQDTGPVSVAVADLNGDGVPDIVFAGSGGVGVLLGNGDGTFGEPSFFFTGGNATFVTVADVNGDGKPDLIVANSGGGDQIGSVSVMLGNGDGTFQSPSVLLPVANPTSVAVADVNGDGIPDLVVTDAATGTVDVFLGVGNGTFKGPLVSPAGPDPTSVAVADLNGDGIADVVVTNPGTNTVSVLIGNGDGTFRSPVAFAAGQGPADVAVADVNGDGNPDLVVADSTGQNVAVLLGDGAGGFAAPVAFPAGANPLSVVVADVNGDRRPDIVADGAGGGGALLGDGNGSFAGPAYTIDPTQVPGDIVMTVSGVAVAANQTLTLQGTFAEPGAQDMFTVDISWGDGSPDTVLSLGPQARSFAAPHVYTAEGTFVVAATVTDSGGDAAASSLVLPVQPAAFGPIAVVQDQPGQTATASAGVPGVGFFGTVTLAQAPEDAHGVELLLAQLATTALASFDVREFGATALDVGVVTFQFPTTLAPGTPLILEFLDPLTNTLRVFQPAADRPGSFALFVGQGFVFGRVLFDNTSTPKLTQLTGTEFTVAVGVAGSPSNVTAVSRALTSSNPGATAPLGTAAFQSTSQLTFSLAASQASQVSAGLLSVGNASAAGGGGTETDASTAAAAWVEFVADEFGDDPQAVWQYGGEAALRLWVQKPHRPLPPAAPPPDGAPTPAPSPRGKGETSRPEARGPTTPAAPGPSFAAGDGARPPRPADLPTMRPARACLAAASLAGLTIPIPELIRDKKRRRPTGA